MNPAALTAALSAALIGAHLIARRSQGRPPGSPARLILATLFSTAAAWLAGHDNLSAALNVAGALWCWQAALAHPRHEQVGTEPTRTAEQYPATQAAPLSRPAFPPVHAPTVVVRERHDPAIPTRQPAPAPSPLPNDHMINIIVQEAQNDHQRLKRASSTGPTNQPGDQPGDQSGDHPGIQADHAPGAATTQPAAASGPRPAEGGAPPPTRRKSGAKRT